MMITKLKKILDDLLKYNHNAEIFVSTEEEWLDLKVEVPEPKTEGLAFIYLEGTEEYKFKTTSDLL